MSTRPVITEELIVRQRIPETPACESCIVTRPACGGCGKKIADIVVGS
jgi:hypothetical protein